MEDKEFNSGLIEKTEISPVDFIAGDYSPLVWTKRVDASCGFWKNFVPVREVQNDNGIDKMNCTTMATDNFIETDIKEKTGIELNVSDRFVAKVSGNSKWGNYVNYPIEAIMRLGFVLEEEYPEEYKINPPSWDEYYKEITSDLFKKALPRLSEYEFDREFILNKDNENLYERLKESPMKVTVSYASAADPETILNPTSKINHDVLIIGAEYGKYWEIYDSYSWLVGQPTIKRYDWNYQFGTVMRIHIKLKNNNNYMIFKQNYPYLLVEGNSQYIGFYLDGKLVIDEDWSKIIVQSASRLKRYEPAIPVKLADWNSIPHVNLKGETIS